MCVKNNITADDPDAQIRVTKLKIYTRALH